jgi:hypothetical protein
MGEWQQHMLRVLGNCSAARAKEQLYSICSALAGRAVSCQLYRVV